ncbi:MAG: hypothetical protein HKL95_07905, partial [Phycisphaerae bacterium]|nr:hypothetical protein [Phycisphaerae bacterium]
MMTLLFGSWRQAGTTLGLVLAGLGMMALAGCGYTSRSIYPTSITTVAVPVFKN